MGRRVHLATAGSAPSPAAIISTFRSPARGPIARLSRTLKRLESIISVSVVDPFMGENGWAFRAPDGSLTEAPTPAALFGRPYPYSIYNRENQHSPGGSTFS